MNKLHITLQQKEKAPLGGRRLVRKRPPQPTARQAVAHKHAPAAAAAAACVAATLWPVLWGGGTAGGAAPPPTATAAVAVCVLQSVAVALLLGVRGARRLSAKVGAAKAGVGSLVLFVGSPRWRRKFWPRWPAGVGSGLGGVQVGPLARWFSSSALVSVVSWPASSRAGFSPASVLLRACSGASSRAGFRFAAR